MPITIYPGTIKKRNANGTYSDLVPGADVPVSEIEELQNIVGDGQLSGFTSTDLTGATNELKNTLNQLESEIGIVVDGQSCVLGASQGQYVILKNSTISGLSDGLYTAAQAIPAGEQNVTSAMLTGPISGGGLNSLKNLADFANTHGSDTLYAGSGTYRNDIGTELPLTYPVGGARKSIYYTVMLFEGSISSADRRTVILPAPNNGRLSASYYPYAYSGGFGSVRVEISNNTFTLINATASSLYVGAIYSHY